MTVEQLAARWGVTVPEAMALCRATGVAVSGPSSVVSPADAARLQDVLEGRVPLPEPGRPRSSASGPGLFGVIAAVVAGVAVLVGLALIGGNALGGDTDIRVSAGDCFDADLLGGTVFGSGIEPAPCASAAYRAYAVLDLDEVWSEWPGADEIEARGQDRCTVLAEGQIDTDSFATTTIYAFGPMDAAAWENDESHKIVCAVRNV